jgi:adenine phosphoribosyltransferase
VSAEDLRAKIREVPDFPKPGILFYDITTLLKDAAAYRESIRQMIEPYRNEPVDIVVGM